MVATNSIQTSSSFHLEDLSSKQFLKKLSKNHWISILSGPNGLKFATLILSQDKKNIRVIFKKRKDDSPKNFGKFTKSKDGIEDIFKSCAEYFSGTTITSNKVKSYMPLASKELAKGEEEF